MANTPHIYLIPLSCVWIEDENRFPTTNSLRIESDFKYPSNPVDCITDVLSQENSTECSGEAKFQPAPHE